MRKPVTSTAVILLALTGCSAAVPEATPTPEVVTNAEPCADFGALVATLPEAMKDDSQTADDMWEGARIEFDEVALAAEGVVQDRMLTFVENWPELFDILVWHEFDEINGHIEAVRRACSADGVETSIGTLSAQ